jgi:type IV pilus assembly protein PilY1
LVASPAENYHLLYRDLSYSKFYQRWRNRRHMIYYGSNSGMLHASNGGFFKYNNRFCLTPECQLDGSGNELNTSNAPALGTEMWAYVPYNLIPHLACLTDPGYAHKYYVDLRPRIFDVQIFKPEDACGTEASPTPMDPGCIHPEGWGTILVGGMRFGGSPTRIDNLVDTDGDGTPETQDNREFTSAYFILDITNPEAPPTLLGEFTRTVDSGGNSTEVDLGYTTVISTMIPMKIEAEAGYDKNCNGADNDPEISKWFLVLGSGPDEIDGTSSQPGKVSIVPLERLVDTDGAGADVVEDMRIPATVPASPDEFGTFTLPDTDSFTSDLITVDFEIQRDYLADVVYFGTVSGGWDDGIAPDGWGGKLYRLVTRDWVACDGRSTQVYSPPSSWSGLYAPDTTPFLPLIDVQQPITAAPTVGTDGRDFYVFFGTGRFFDLEDKNDNSSNSTQTFYGLREPVSKDTADLSFLSGQPDPPPCQLTWSQIWNDRLSPETGGLKPDGVTPLTVSQRANLGLVPVHDIDILSTDSLYENGTLACKDGTTDCLDSSLVLTLAEATALGDPSLEGETKSMKALIDYIKGDYIRCVGTNIGKDGWYRDLPDKRERSLGQASLISGLLNYNSYQPFSDVCLNEGLGYLYGLYYITGTPWVKDVFGIIDYASNPRVANPERVSLGKGLSTTPNIHVGEYKGGKAFVQTSVGKIMEIQQPNLPEEDVKSGRIKWRDIEE